MKGELYFNQTPVASVAKELERIYNCTIQIENDAIKQELVYGEHSNENLDSVLKSLEYVLGIKYKKEGTNVILYK
jgi:ferric-dicitrate binding protein FerR (iron transport regulator)